MMSLSPLINNSRHGRQGDRQFVPLRPANVESAPPKIAER